MQLGLDFRSGPAAWLKWGVLLVAVVVGGDDGSYAADGEPPVIRAQLTPRRYAVVSSEISAKINRFCVPEGGAFKEGELLVSFDASLHLAHLERAEAVLAASDRTATANQRLLALNSVGQIEAENSQADLRKARADVVLAKAMLAKCEIKAPFSGRISEQRVRELEFVQPGQPMFEIIDDALPQIDFIAPSHLLATLRIGDPLEVRIDETRRTYAAAIERIGAKVDPISQSVKIVAGFGSAHPELMAGMSGSIVFKPGNKR